MNWTWLYVLALYAIALFIARRSAKIIEIRIGVLFASLVLLFLAPQLFGPYTAAGLDYVMNLPPWGAIRTEWPQSNPSLNDIGLQIVPWMHLAREGWTSLSTLLWSESAGAGFPLLGSAQSAVFSPYTLLTLPLPLLKAAAAAPALKLLAALTFTYLYCRRRGLGPVAGVAGAVTFAFSTCIVVWLNFPLGSAASFLPAIFYAVDRVIEERRYRDFLLLTFSFAAIVVAGHPETAAHAVLVAAAYASVRMIAVRPHFGVPLRLLGAGIVALLLTLPFLAAFFDALPQSVRFETMSEREMHVAHPRELVLFLSPRYFGGWPDEGGRGAGDVEFVASYAGIAAFAGWFFVLLTPRLWRRNAPVAFHLFAAPLALLLALGWTPFARAFDALPLLSVGVHGRLRIIAAWSMAVLLAVAVDSLVRSTERWRAAAAAVLAAGLIVWLLLAWPLLPEEQPVAMRTIVAQAVVLALFAALALPERWRGLAAGALVAAVIVDLWIVGYDWNGPSRIADAYPPTPLIETLERAYADRDDDPRQTFRIAGLESALFPNTSAIYGFEDIRAHDPMANARVIDVIDRFANYDPSEYFLYLTNVDPRVLNLLGVRYLVTSPAVPAVPEWPSMYQGSDGVVFRNEGAFDRFFAVDRVVVEDDPEQLLSAMKSAPDLRQTGWIDRWPRGASPALREELVSASEGRANVRSHRVTSSRWVVNLSLDSPRLIASSIAHYPGWRAIDATTEEPIPTVRVNHAFVGFLAPAGQSRVTLIYRPPGFTLACIVALTTLTLLAVFARTRSPVSPRERVLPPAAGKGSVER